MLMNPSHPAHAYTDVSTPSLDNPFSYFTEWDLHEDDDEMPGSQSPSPRGKADICVGKRPIFSLWTVI